MAQNRFPVPSQTTDPVPLRATNSDRAFYDLCPTLVSTVSAPDLWHFPYFPDNMNTPRSFSNRQHETTRMAALRNPLSARFEQLIAVALIAALLALGATPGLKAQEPSADSVSKNATGPTDLSKAADPAKSSKTSEASKTTRRRQRPIDVLREARARIQKLVPFRAEIVETIVVRGKRFRASGKYLQGPGHKLRLEFDLEVGSTKGSLIQVCDGTTLFTQQKIGLVVQATRRDVPRILKEMKTIAAKAGSRTRPAQFEADLGLGGLAALLGSLEDSMSFTQLREQTFQDRPFIIIEGGWNATFLETLTDDDQPAGGGLPEYVPDRVRVYIDKQTRFAHRIVYLKKNDTRQALRPMVSLEFRNVQLNAPLNDAAFGFRPDAGIRVQDVTDDYIRQIRQAQSDGQTRGQAPGGAPAGSPAPQPPSR
jgi:hypothetical protein